MRRRDVTAVTCVNNCATTQHAPGMALTRTPNLSKYVPACSWACQDLTINVDFNHKRCGLFNKSNQGRVSYNATKPDFYVYFLL